MRRPNYRQERMDRARKQAKKTADKVAARAERSAKAVEPLDGEPTSTDDASATGAGPSDA